MNRAEQRNALIAARRAISTPMRKKWDAQIAEQVVAWCEEHSIKKAGLYNSIQAEPCLCEIFPLLSEMGIELSFPIAPDKKQPLTFAVWKLGDQLMKDRFGILIPLETAPVTEPEVVFIPCVGFTTERYRLGYGCGFYDRTLAERPHIKSVGIAYRFCQCEMEVMSHDIAMDCIITNY